MVSNTRVFRIAVTSSGDYPATSQIVIIVLYGRAYVEITSTVIVPTSYRVDQTGWIDVPDKIREYTIDACVPHAFISFPWLAPALVINDLNVISVT